MNNIPLGRMGLIGKSLSHSFSKQYFEEKFIQEKIHNIEYELFSINNIDEIEELLADPSSVFFNITIPYKTDIIRYLDGLDTTAREIGAVNCIIKQNNLWIGYNTDIIGFEELLKEMKGVKFKLPCENSKLQEHALVLGSGGACKAVCYVLKQRDIPYQIISRNKTEKTITYGEVTHELIHHSKYIINTTPLGMFPNIETLPQIPYMAVHCNHIFIDLIYNPSETLFLQEGKKRGASTINGLTMLRKQADASWNLYVSKKDYFCGLLYIYNI